MEALALGALKAFLATLYPDDGTPVKGVALKLSEHCLEELKEADKSQAGLAVKILGAAIESSGRCWLAEQNGADMVYQTDWQISLCRRACRLS